MNNKIESKEGKVDIPMSIQYWLLFLALTFLCYAAHETFHHLMGGILCGGLGTMTLTIYTPKPLCSLNDAVTLAGPILSFAIAWVGAYWLMKSRLMLFAYTLIFASFAHLRFPLPLTRSGDEWSVLRQYLQDGQFLPGQFLLACILFLLALPPLVIAYRAIANRKSLPIFIVSLLLPLLLLYILPFVDTWLFGPDLDRASLSFLGIPVIILLTDIFMVALFVLGGKQMFHLKTFINS
jgi:hypothetical protein